MAEPPSLLGGVHVTVACALPAVADPIVGAPGTVVTAAIVVLVSTAGAPACKDALRGREVCVALGHDGGVPVGVTPSHGGTDVGDNNPALGHPTMAAVIAVPKIVMLAEVSNSNWAQLRAVPTAPDAVRVTVTVGVVSVAPAGIWVIPVETSRYGKVGFGPPKPVKLVGVAGGGGLTAKGTLLCAVHPAWPATVHSVMLSAALPDGGRLALVPPVQLIGPEASALTYVDPAGIS
jgi:hypothetical protein